MKYCLTTSSLLLALSSLFLFNLRLSANTGMYAIPVAVDYLQIDGDLSDWPADIPAQRLAHHQLNDLKGPKDADVRFWVAYNRSQHVLYVAIRAEDDVFRTERANKRMPQGLGTHPDGPLIYLDLGNRTNQSRPIELSYLSNIGAYGSGAALPPGIVEVARKMTATTATYEWVIRLDYLAGDTDLLEGDAVIGFEALYFDRDSEEDGTIVKWIDGENRGEDTRRIGDLYLVDPNTQMATVSGKTTWSAPIDRHPPQFAILEKVDDPSFQINIYTDEAGVFSVPVPKGSYRILADDPLSIRSQAEALEIEINSDYQLTAPLRTVRVSGELDEFLPALMAEQQVRATAVAFVEDGRIQFSKTYGVDQYGSKADNRTVFRVASITKAVATMTALSLAEKGWWDLDTPLARYWVDPQIAEDERHLKLTSRTVLRHLSGLPNWRNWRSGLKFMYAPHTIQSYSGEGFEYLRRAIEKKTWRSFEVLSKNHVFGPAGMSSTTHVWNEDWIPQRFAGEFYGDGTAVKHSTSKTPNAAANLITNADDLARFAIWVMKGAEISEERWKEVFTPNDWELIDQESKYQSRNGLGWFVHQQDERLLIEHSGGQFGIRTHLIILPEEKKALVVLTNGTAGNPILQSVFHALLNPDGSLAKTEATMYPE